MKLILTAPIDKLGVPGDIVEVQPDQTGPEDAQPTRLDRCRGLDDERRTSGRRCRLGAGRRVLDGQTVGRRDTEQFRRSSVIVSITRAPELADEEPDGSEVGDAG